MNYLLLPDAAVGKPDFLAEERSGNRCQGAAYGPVAGADSSAVTPAHAWPWTGAGAALHPAQLAIQRVAADPELAGGERDVAGGGGERLLCCLTTDFVEAGGGAGRHRERGGR